VYSRRLSSHRQLTSIVVYGWPRATHRHCLHAASTLYTNDVLPCTSIDACNHIWKSVSCVQFVAFISYLYCDMLSQCIVVSKNEQKLRNSRLNCYALTVPKWSCTEIICTYQNGMYKSSHVLKCTCTEVGQNFCTVSIHIIHVPKLSVPKWTYTSLALTLSLSTHHSPQQMQHMFAFLSHPLSPYQGAVWVHQDLLFLVCHAVLLWLWVEI